MTTWAEFVESAEDTTSTSITVFVGEPSMAGQIPDGISLSDAPVLAGEQAYYWTAAWQHGELASLADLAAGRARDFDDPFEAVRWLFGV
jgi:hypothetical protein